eukprot:8904375-Prorocentrum_lima.AAC.1
MKPGVLGALTQLTQLARKVLHIARATAKTHELITKEEAPLLNQALPASLMRRGSDPAPQP